MTVSATTSTLRRMSSIRDRVVALFPGYIRLRQHGEAVNSDLRVPLNGASVEAIDGASQ
jgi:hypothetical protein